MIINRSRYVALAGTCSVLAAGSAVRGQQFIPLDVFGGTLNVLGNGAYAVSADGTVVAGLSYPSAFRWTQAEGIQDLGLVPEATDAYASGISGDGLVIVGTVRRMNTWAHAFRWTASTGMVDILPNADAYDTNADGSVVVGARNNTSAAFRWTPTTTQWFSPQWPESTAVAAAVTADGQTTIGYVTYIATYPIPMTGVMWSDTGVQTSLVPGAVGGARAASPDGAYIVGHAGSVNTHYRASRLKPTVLDLGVLAGESESWALGVSADGQMIVGCSWTGAAGFSGRALLWTSALGTVDLKSWLVSRGVNLTDWSLISANAVSADGTTIVGQAIGPDGMRRGFVVRMGSACYANCDASTSPPALNVNDFICFQNRFAAGDSYANCDGSTQAPVLNVNDFTCYLNRYAAGCP